LLIYLYLYIIILVYIIYKKAVMVLKDIEINTPFIKLGQFLKFANLANGGGDVKAILKAENAKVDGEIETRRGRKLYPEMTVEVEGEESFTIKDVHA